jgi:speckle-type POZ protein
MSEVTPGTFKALLHYVYTDSLPAMDHLSSDLKTAMLKNLLASADTFGMEKLKLACKNALRGWVVFSFI